MCLSKHDKDNSKRVSFFSDCHRPTPVLQIIPVSHFIDYFETIIQNILAKSPVLTLVWWQRKPIMKLY